MTDRARKFEETEAWPFDSEGNPKPGISDDLARAKFAYIDYVHDISHTVGHDLVGFFLNNPSFEDFEKVRKKYGK